MFNEIMWRPLSCFFFELKQDLQGKAAGGSSIKEQKFQLGRSPASLDRKKTEVGDVRGRRWKYFRKGREAGVKPACVLARMVLAGPSGLTSSHIAVWISCGDEELEGSILSCHITRASRPSKLPVACYVIVGLHWVFAHPSGVGDFYKLMGGKQLPIAHRVFM